jgi:hypothetical protein
MGVRRNGNPVEEPRGLGRWHDGQGPKRRGEEMSKHVTHSWGA